MSNKIFVREKLKKILQSLQKRGKKVVFTNGCYDILHVGHIRLLKKCKQLGDILVMAVNTDNSVRRMKGPPRPIVNQKERAEVLASIEYVDFVTFFDEDTPLETIKLLKPDILVKGGDWQKKDIVGHNIVSKTVRFPTVKGKSTTNLIKKIVQAYGK